MTSLLPQLRGMKPEQSSKIDCHSPKGLCNDNKNDIDSSRFYTNTSEYKEILYFLGRFSQGCVEIFRQAKTQKSIT
ncbi:Uncharacterised protein [Helicobacter fennelliae]|nr:Uncharacterised protein [Helicobacter fennelliae]